jgi:hypothetical protein
VLPIEGDEAVLLAHADGKLAIVREGDASLLAPGIDATVLPALLRGGAVTAHARLTFSHAKGSGTHLALGIATDGHIILARSEAPTGEPLAQALKMAGCADAVLLDRGEAASGAIRRAGTTSPPVLRSDETSLFVLGRSMRPRSFHFTPLRP